MNNDFRRRIWVLMLAMAFLLNGCILNSSPKETNVTVKVGESQTFTVKTFVGSTYFTLDGTQVLAGSGSKTFTYTYTPTEADSDTTHTLNVSNIVPLVSPEERTWTITVPAYNPKIILNPIEDIFTNEAWGGLVYNNEHLHATNFAYHEVTFLKFDLSQIGANPINTISVHLFELPNGYYTRPDIDTIEVYRAQHNNWDESSSYSQIPQKLGGSISQASYPANWYDWMVWDLTGVDFSNEIASGYLTLVLENNQSGLWDEVLWASKDYSDISLIPYLEIN